MDLWLSSSHYLSVGSHSSFTNSEQPTRRFTIRYPTPFIQVSRMNVAFNNPQGTYDEDYIDWTRIEKQCKSIQDEYNELLEAIHYKNADKLRDALCDVQVFALGAQHLLGVDGDADLEAVVHGVMTRFVKNEADKEATTSKHAANGIHDVYFEGEYPTMVMKSASDQPDAPKGKFLKSASFSEPWFDPFPLKVDIRTPEQVAKEYLTVSDDLGGASDGWFTNGPSTTS